MKLKRSIFDVCYVATILSLLILVASMFFVDADNLYPLFYTTPVIIFRGFSLFLLFILLFKSFIVWSKNDRNLKRLLLLVFFHGFYLIYYYPKIVKNNWL